MRVKRLLPSLMPEMLLTLVIASHPQNKKIRFLVVKVL